MWEQSKDIAAGLLETTQETASGIWDDASKLFVEDPPNDSFGRIWNDIVPKLEQTLTLEERHEELPETSWFGADRVSNREDIFELLDQAVAILANSPVQNYRQRIRELEQTIRMSQNEIAEFRTRRIAAPRDSLWQKTVHEYDRAIEERQQRIRQFRGELRSIQQEFSKQLQSLGLVLRDEQVEFLLSTVIGDNLLELGIAFDNVKTITIQLQNLLEETEEDLDSARRYYGMYVVLLGVLERMHTHLIDAINNRYVREIDAIMTKTRELTLQTRNLQKGAGANQKMLTSNLEAQRVTLQAATAYRSYLLDQSQALNQAQRRLAQDRATAWNTYDTVKVSADLVALIKTSQNLLQNLLTHQVPTLRSFQNLEMKREFAKLTSRLRDKG